LSVASLRILGISSGFSAFGGVGPRPFVTFGAMPKVKPRSLYSLAQRKTKSFLSGFLMQNIGILLF
jgi:hypothetical protein